MGLGFWHFVTALFMVRACRLFVSLLPSFCRQVGDPGRRASDFKVHNISCQNWVKNLHFLEDVIIKTPFLSLQAKNPEKVFTRYPSTNF